MGGFRQKYRKIPRFVVKTTPPKPTPNQWGLLCFNAFSASSSLSFSALMLLFSLCFSDILKPESYPPNKVASRNCLHRPFRHARNDLKINPLRIQAGHPRTFVGRFDHGHCSGTPNPYHLSEKHWQYTSNVYCNAPPICNAVPCWLLSLEDRETPQYTSHLYCSMPPVCTAVRLPFVPALLLRKYRRLGVLESS